MAIVRHTIAINLFIDYFIKNVYRYKRACKIT